MQLGPRIETGEHYALLRHILTLQPKGTALEFGVGKGESTRILAAHLSVVAFDSWKGLPTDWRPGFPKGSFRHRKPQIRNVVFVDGWFADTVPAFNFETLGYIGVVHVDCDLYSSTAVVLEHLAPHLEAGCFLVFDEFHSYPGAELHEQRAFNQFVEATGFTFEVVGHGFEQWAVQLT